MAKEEVVVPISWVGLEDQTIVFANQFMSQFNQDEFVITFGQAAPPVLLGNEAERLHQLKQLPFIPIKTVGRFTMTRARLQELVNLLKQNLEQFDTKGMG